ncbi:hypothetical protein GC177_03810 [bacterium]|nr:hypothetical protein [bacterium]
MPKEPTYELDTMFETILQDVADTHAMQTLEEPIRPSVLDNPDLQGTLYSPIIRNSFDSHQYHITSVACPAHYHGRSFYNGRSETFLLEVIGIPFTQKDVQNSMSALKHGMAKLMPPEAVQLFTDHSIRQGLSKKDADYEAYTESYMFACRSAIRDIERPIPITRDTMFQLRSLAKEKNGRAVRDALNELDTRPYVANFPELAITMIAYGTAHRRFIAELLKHTEQSNLREDQKANIADFFSGENGSNERIDFNLRLDNLFTIIIPLICAEYASPTIQEMDPAKRMRCAIQLAMVEINELDLFDTITHQAAHPQLAEALARNPVPEDAYFPVKDNPPDIHFVCPAKAHIQKTMAGVSETCTQQGHEGEWLSNAVDFVRENPDLFSDITRHIETRIVKKQDYPPIQIDELGQCPDNILTTLTNVIGGILRG